MHKINGKDIIAVITKGRLAKFQKKTVTPTASVQTVKPDTGYDGLSEVEIGKYAAKYQKKTVTPKATIQTIKPDSNYDGLSEVIVNPGYENSISAYLDKSLTKVTASDLATVTSIGEIGLDWNKKGTFQGFEQLESVVIPENVTLIGDSVFSQCKELVTVTLPDSLTEIGASAFYMCHKLKNINAPASLKKIGAAALESSQWYDDQWMLHCYDKKEDIYFGKHLYKAHPYKETITIKNDTVGIAGKAFANAEIKSVTIPNKVTYIGDYAFSGSNLTTIVFGDNSSLKEIGQGAFESVYNIKNITIPETVTEIGRTAFRGSGLVNVSFLGNSIESLAGTFEWCTDLETVLLPSGLKRLENGVFDQCTALTSITIPESVVYMNPSTFLDCSNLASVIMLPTTPPTVEWEGLFDSCSADLQITVPAGCGDIYKAATGWSNYADKIVEATE